MKILTSSQHFWPENFRINDLVQTLVERGLEIDILTGKPNYPEGRIYPGYHAWGCQRERCSGATVFRVPLVARGSGSAFRLAINYLSFIVSGLVFAPWLLRRRRYDAIFVYASSPVLQAIPALFLGWAKRCPVIVWIQDLWPESLAATGYVRNPVVLAWVGRIVKFIYRHSDLLLIQSRAYELPVRSLAPGKPVEYFPNSVEAVYCAPCTSEAVAVPGLDAGFPVVFAGNIGTGQAVEVIVEAASLLVDHREIRFVVLGEGVRRSWLCDEVRSRGLNNVYVPGRYPLEVMPCLLGKAATLLLTLADEPVFAATVPSKLQTYLAVGKPILASLNGEGARMVTEAEAGLATPAGDGAALADAVVRLYKMSPARRRELGRNGRVYYERNFDRERLVDQLVKHFGSVSSLNRSGV